MNRCRFPAQPERKKRDHIKIHDEDKLGLNRVIGSGLGDQYNRSFWAGSVSAKKAMLGLGFQFFFSVFERFLVMPNVSQ